MTTPLWVTFVEIDISYCSNTYGVAPCTASIPTTGSQKCFNALGSCQDRANYNETFVTLRFTKDSGYQAESGIEAIPSLLDAELTPGVISLGEDLGQRPSVTCTFRDHPHSDTGAGFDKYLSTRTYDPFSQGTFWGKFAARQPNLRGKKLRVIQGTVGQTIGQMEARHYIIDSVDGPALDGTFTIVAKDPLKALDAERAQAPAVSSGFLNADLTTSSTTATLSPGGVGNSEYPASGYLNLSGTEIVAFTRSADTLTITRGQKGTSAATHAAGDRAQVVLVYAAQDPAVIIKDLLVTYGGISSSYVPLSDWQAETAAYNGQVYSAVIPEPTAAKALVAELIQEAGLAVWWDEVGEQMRLQVLRAIPTTAQVYDETMYVAGSLQVSAQPDKRASQVWTYFGQINPLNGVDLNNLPGIAVLENTDSEIDYCSAAVKTITSRWIPTGGRLIAERINEIQLGRYLIPPRKVQFDLVADGSIALPKPGDGRQLSHLSIQDVDGERTELPFSVTSIKLKDGVCSVSGEELQWTDLQPDPLNRVIAVDYNGYNLNFRSLHDLLFGTPTAGGTVTLQIASTAKAGSTSTGTPAFDTGTWPSLAFTATRTSGSAVLTSIADTSAFVAGQAVTGTGIQNGSRVVSKTSSSVTLDKTASAGGTSSLTLWTTILKLVVDGQIIGKGGKGGDGHNGDNWTGNSGASGGLGLKVQAPVEITGAGKIDGGGGGGGAAGSDYIGWFGPQVYGGAGGGGAGLDGGDGGSGVISPGGSPGTVDAGGAGGSSNYSGWHGGAGGSPGAGGSSATGDFAGSGGPAGNSVDGYSLVKDSAFTGAYRGGKIN